MEKLKTTSEWTIWKTRDNEWSPALRKVDFHQLLNIHKGKRAECWGFKIDQVMVEERRHPNH